MRCTVTQLARERSVGLCPLGGSYVREFELSHSSKQGYKNNVCTQFAREDVGLSPFYNLCVKERILFTRLLCSNDFNKSPPFLTSAKKITKKNLLNLLN